MGLPKQQNPGAPLSIETRERARESVRGRRACCEEEATTETTMEGEPTRIMLAVNQSTIKGYPHPSISSKRAFEWTLQKIVRSNTSGFKFLFLHVLVPDEDGTFSFSFYSLLLFFIASFPDADRSLCEMRCYSVICFLFFGI